MSRLVIFGGTGMTGQCVVKYALEKGLKTRIMVRSETTVPDCFKSQVEVFKGDVLNFDDVSRATQNQDLVCVVLGTRNDLASTTMLSTGMQNIVNAMKTANMKKVSVCLSSFLFFEPDKVPKMFADLTADHRRMLQIIQDSGLEYRAILPPHIADEPSTEYAIAYNKSPGFSRLISKIDLAKFLIDSLYNEEHAQQIIGICAKTVA
ncbi:flavin reductase (NADPH) [Toxorhynchites rutilus septentrionalis]|uniref:flavin reductase (NADPH) n=1 Tax=Toxorhynchites rutilus septentrionalis TaxID=329112 RepID=UPI002479C2E3|nr:flavin reductase (NADPH) [Toxorhynchites rutilus septentrionalis]